MDKYRNIKVNSRLKYIKENEHVMIHAYKWNGWLYRTWNYPLIIDVKDDWIVACSKNSIISTAEEQTTRTFKSKNESLTFWFFSSKEWFNILITVEKSGIRIYINVSSPYLYEEGAIKYFDFDLDFKINEDNKWKEIDVDEFFIHQKKFRYPENLINEIMLKEKDIVNKIENGYFNKFIDKQLLSDLYKKFVNFQKNDERFGENEFNKKNN